VSRLAIFGAGYAGLVTGAGFAELKARALEALRR
jgi:UDP-glucose 6-dehydrogenase